MKIKTPLKLTVVLRYPTIGFCFLLLTCFVTSLQAGLLDDLVKETKENLKEAVENSKEDIKKETKSISDDINSGIKEQINATANEITDNIKEGMNSAASSTLAALKGNKNRIMNLAVEGIVVGGDVGLAEHTLVKAGYKKSGDNPGQFQKDSNLLKLSSTNGMISSIELEGAVAEDTFIDKERSRIESALGKACPPTKLKGTWFCNLEGDNEEYYFELKVRRNKYSYLIEGDL